MAEMTKNQSGESKPVPDPTSLTTEQLIREINRLEDLVKLRAEAGRAELEGEIALTNERFKTMRQSLDERFATQQFAISTADLAATHVKQDAKELFDSKLTDLREVLNERYATQTKALDAAFLAQQAAVATSFDAQREAIAAALLAAKEAVEKANVATEKRFDSVTEVLAGINASMTVLIPRAEAENRMADLDRRVTEVKSTVDKGFTGVDVRHETGTENRLAYRDVRTDSRANIAIAISVGMGVLTIISMILINAMHAVGH